MNYFKIDEFKCRCCNKIDMNPRFLNDIDLLREMCKFPFVITSGYRCEAHNKMIGGALKSFHLLGLAADVSIENVTSTQLYRLVTFAINLNFNIGIYEDFIHLDLREYLDDESSHSRVMWIGKK